MTDQTDQNELSDERDETGNFDKPKTHPDDPSESPRTFHNEPDAESISDESRKKNRRTIMQITSPTI